MHRSLHAGHTGNVMERKESCSVLKWRLDGPGVIQSRVDRSERIGLQPVSKATS